MCKCTNEKIPYFNAPIFLENKQQIGKVDEIFGPIRDFVSFVYCILTECMGRGLIIYIVFVLVIILIWFKHYRIFQNQPHVLLCSERFYYWFLEKDLFSFINGKSFLQGEIVIVYSLMSHWNCICFCSCYWCWHWILLQPRKCFLAKLHGRFIAAHALPWWNKDFLPFEPDCK